MVVQCFLSLFLRIISLIFSFSSRIISIPLSRTSINGISRRIIRSAIIVAAIALIIIAIRRSASRCISRSCICLLGPFCFVFSR
uniref:Uncharacterized protein n=1 Tax=Coriandrum sativum TaxID=4047 RepID=A0A8A4HP77_CORSA|nr:hypothetical protein LWA87_mgp13 [Coriandrum sativum]QTC08327.1 hypothetical protein [Coriandrum sativum]